MKKLFAGLLAAFMVAAALVASTGGTAQAACTRYAGCPSTSTTISGPAVKNEGAPITFTSAISVNGSDAAPRGTARIVVVGAGTRNQGSRFSQAKAAKRVNQFNFGRKLAPGKYTVRVVFTSNGTQDDSSSATRSFKVRNN